MRFKKLVLYLFLLGSAWTFIYPFVWMASLSFRPPSEISNLSLFSSNFTLENYIAVFQRIPIGRAFLNSLVVATAITTSVLFFSSLTGYALSRISFRGNKTVMMILLATMAIPGQLTLIPMYRLIVAFGWIDSYLALVVPALMSGMGILIFRQTFMALPSELFESARMEGAGELLILRRICWPLSKPALVTVGILTFLGSWNEVLWPMIVIREQTMMTMPQMVVLFSKGGQAGGQMGIELAAAMLLVLPALIAYICFQRYFVESIATSGIKG